MSTVPADLFHVVCHGEETRRSSRASLPPRTDSGALAASSELSSDPCPLWKEATGSSTLLASS